MPLIVYLDETGDPSLAKIDKTFPVFALVMLACEVNEYVNHIVPQVYQLKMDFFGHEGVIIHSRDIRKAQGDFGYLTDPAKRQQFYARINALMSDCAYTLFAAVIHKHKYKEKYRDKPLPVYDLALELALEWLVPYLEKTNQDEVVLVAEARGKNEDNNLLLSFLKTLANGTDSISRQRFQQIKFRLEFKPKAMNIVGTQLADLAAYPIGRYVLDPNKENPAYEIIKGKICQEQDGATGLRILP